MSMVHRHRRSPGAVPRLVLFMVKGWVMFPAAAALGCGRADLYRHRVRYLGLVDTSVPAPACPRASGERSCLRPCSVLSVAYLRSVALGICATLTSPSLAGGLGTLVAVAVLDPGDHLHIARISLAGVAVLGLALVGCLSVHGFGACC